MFIPLSIACHGLAQNNLRPGDPHIKTEWLTSSHDFYRNVITDSSGNIKYDFMMENVCAVDTQAKRITFARFRQVPIGSFSTDTSVTDLSLKPFRMHEIHQQRHVSFEMEFEDRKATVKTTRNGTATTKSYPMETGYFEDNMIEYIFGCLQLEKGKTYLMNNFNPATPGNDPYTVRYEFDDTWIPAADLKITCTVLYFTHGSTTGYIWLDKSSHKILKTLGRSKDYTYVLTRQ
jgi:hypothetical protein